MAHISLSPAVAAAKFSPIEKSYDRITKEGVVPQINFLLGSQYNIPIGGETSINSVGNITNDAVRVTGGKLEIDAESTDGSEVEKIVSFTSFMYFYPGIKVVGNSEIQDDDVGPPTLPTQRMRYEIQDLATEDKLRIDLEGGDGQAEFKVRQVVDGVETILAEASLTAGITEVKWEIVYLEQGLTKIYYKEPVGDRIRIFSGTLGSDLGESRLSASFMSTQQTLKTVKSDFIWIYYPNLFVGFGVSLTDRLNGRVRIFDTNNEASEADWDEVFASDHPFVGERVVQNGLVRLWFKTTPKMDVYGWNVDATAWELTGSVIPKSSLGDVATGLKDIIFNKFNDIHVKAIVKYGIVTHFVNLRRGQASARIFTNSKQFRINTAKRRFALSTGTTATQIQDFNQLKSDDTNRGNPLNLSPTVNPFIFTNDSDVDTGLLLVDDNWFSYYNENDATDTAGFVGVTKRPTGMEVSAVSATELNNIDFTFDINAVFCVGILEGDPTTKINNIPVIFNIGDIDTYVKWRANEGIYGFDQRGYVKRKR
jgi:hypothetical protein